MLIKALCEYHDILSEKGEVVEDGFCSVSVDYLIALTPEGTIGDIIEIRDKIETNKNGKTKIDKRSVKRTFPFREKATSIKAYKIDHRPRYIFGLNYEKEGLTPSDDKNTAKISHQKFVETNLEFIDGLDSPLINAFRNFLNTWEPNNETENPYLIGLGKEISTAGFCFALDGFPGKILNDEEKILQRVRESFNDKVPNEEDVVGICAVLGERNTIARVHNDIKGLIGQKAGSMIAMKNTAAWSYGKKMSYNSNVSETAMKKYVEAFNILTSDKRHKIYVDDMTVIYWAASKDGEKEVDIFTLMNNTTKETPEDVRKSIDNLLTNIIAGKGDDTSGIQFNEDIDFYIVGLVPNSSRVCQKFITHNKFGVVFKNSFQHQIDIAIEGNEHQVTIPQIIGELKSPVATNAKVPPSLASDLFLSILNGTRYPMGLLETVVRRVKTDSDTETNRFQKINRTRIGIIKACINRNLRLQGKKEELTMSLDRESTNQAYLCGRLFATLEKIQGEALGDLNSSIKDSFFASACARPSVVFQRLLMLSQNHLKKLEKGRKIFFNQQIGEIVDALGSAFPSTLSLEDQGRFIIGYYQQYQEYFKKKSE